MVKVLVNFPTHSIVDYYDSVEEATQFFRKYYPDNSVTFDLIEEEQHDNQ